MFGSVRAYSTRAFGYVQTKGPIVSVLAPQPQDRMELFAELKQNDRAKSLHKVENALLWRELNARNRKRVFRPSRASMLESQDEPQTFSMRLSESTTKQIRLEPRTYFGPPSRQDLRVLATTSRTPDEVTEAMSYIRACHGIPGLYRHYYENPELDGFLLKRAAEAGIFQSVYPQLRDGAPLLSLQIYALRMPFLSRRSKSMLGQLYSNAKEGIARDLVYAYGLTQYKQKFGEEHMGRLPEVIESIAKQLPQIRERPRAAMKTMSQVDLVLGRSAMLQCGLPGANEANAALEEIMEKTARGRPLSEALKVNVTDAKGYEADQVTDKEADQEANQELKNAEAR